MAPCKNFAYMKIAMPPPQIGDAGANRIRRAAHWPVLVGALLLILLWLSLAAYVQAHVEASMGRVLAAVRPLAAAGQIVPVERPRAAAQPLISEARASESVAPVSDTSVAAVSQAGRLQAEVDRMLAETPLEFRYMKFQLRDASRRALFRLGERLVAENGDFAVQVRVHANSWGSRRRNLEVSARRAQVVRDELLAAGLPANRVSFEGVGEAESRLGRNESETRRLNRRTEIRIMGN